MIKSNFLDKAIGYFSPKAGAERLKYRAMSTMADSGYPLPGSSTDRAMRGWGVNNQTADADTLPGLPSMRAGSRDLFMNTPISVSILRRFKTNVVGFGLSLQSSIDADFLGLTPEKAREWKRNTEREFHVWAKSKDCDAARTSNFYEMQALAFFSYMLSGDVFISMPYIKRPNTTYNLRMHCLEADTVCNPPERLETVELAGGVEVDDWGAPVAYWIRKFPREQALFSAYTSYNTILGKWERIPVFGPKTGRRQILHLFDKERPGQRRGVPLLAPVLAQLKQISRLSESELMAALVTSFFTVFLENVPAAGGMNFGLSPAQTILNPTANPSDAQSVELGYGSVVSLGTGQKISMADPKRPSSAFDPFFTALVKQISSAVELPFELVLLHFSASYSATRGVMVEAWKKFRERRLWVAGNFCDPVYEEWLHEAILTGRIQAPGFLEDPAIRAAWSKAVWAGPGQGQIDPLKETQAAALRVKERLSTRNREHTQIHGTDWEDDMQTLAGEEQLLGELDLLPPEPEPPGDGKKPPTDDTGGEKDDD